MQLFLSVIRNYFISFITKIFADESFIEVLTNFEGLFMSDSEQSQFVALKCGRTIDEITGELCQECIPTEKKILFNNHFFILFIFGRFVSKTDWPKIII